MTLQNIINSVNIFTDENFSSTQIVELANRAISRINTECSTYFPKYANVTDTYSAIPEDWQKDLIGNYVAYAIKMNDTSLSEAGAYLEEFYNILRKFKESLVKLLEKGQIDEEHIELDGIGGAYGIITSGAINKGFFGSNGNGGSY